MMTSEKSDGGRAGTGGNRAATSHYPDNREIRECSLETSHYPDNREIREGSLETSHYPDNRAIRECSLEKLKLFLVLFSNSKHKTRRVHEKLLC